MKIKKLTAVQIERKSKDLDGWTLNKAKTEISKNFTIASYLDGLAFIARIAVYAEVSHHYPEIIFSQGKVKISLTTTEIKGLSQTDFDMATKIERISAK